MSALPSNIRERLDELLVAQTLGELTGAERAELDAILAQHGEADALARQTDAAAAALLLAFKDEGAVRMPADVKARLLAKGQSMAGGSRSGRDGSSGRAAIGWLMAAALAVVAAIGWLRPVPQAQKPIPAPSPAARFDALKQEAGTRSVQLAGQPRSPGASAVVIWNNDKQEGYLRVNKLAVNDPSQDQYQLWIFDKARATYPVDGGVFDIKQAEIDPKTGDAIIPMRPALRVTDPAAFAVTIEKPGGVVVTDKSGLVLLGAAQ